MIEAVITGVELALPGEHARGERLPRVLEPDSDMEGAGSVLRGVREGGREGASERATGA
jgi:hypothetical protein